MAARYEVRIKTVAGVEVARTDDFVSLTYSHRVNTPGALTLVLGADSRAAALLVRDGQIEIWRRDPDNGIAWYVEWEGLVAELVYSTDRKGRKLLTVTAVGYVDLLARRIVAYKSGSAGADKSGTASTVMREFVEENAGPSALITGGRISDGVTPGLTCGTDPAAGGTWAGGRAYKNLLDVLQSIADQAGVDFDVVGTGAALFEFRLYDGQRGADRTTYGLDRSTGLNAAGHAPVVFSTALGNMAEPKYSASYIGCANRAYVLGQGEGSAREVAVRGNGADSAATALALRETARDARNESSAGALNLIGDALMAQLQPQEEFTFAVLQIPSTLYGKHYTWGDRVTSRYDDIERNKRIIGIRARVAEGGEQLSAEIADVP